MQTITYTDDVSNENVSRKIEATKRVILNKQKEIVGILAKSYEERKYVESNKSSDKLTSVNVCQRRNIGTRTMADDIRRNKKNG